MLTCSTVIGDELALMLAQKVVHLVCRHARPKHMQRSSHSFAPRARRGRSKLARFDTSRVGARLALDCYTRLELHRAAHLELLAVEQRGVAFHQGLHLVHQLVVLVVELDRRLRLARELDCALRRQRVRVRAQGEEVAARLDGREALARHAHRARALEALNRGAHRGFELEHWRAVAVARVDGLLVLDQRQRQHALIRLHCGLERLEVDPQVVRVEVLVLIDVLERGLVLVADHRALAQQQLACMRAALPCALRCAPTQVQTG